MTAFTGSAAALLFPSNGVSVYHSNAFDTVVTPTREKTVMVGRQLPYFLPRGTLSNSQIAAVDLYQLTHQISL